MIEAAILATRLHMLPREKVERELGYLQIAVEKTAGPREHEAWRLLIEKIEDHTSTRPLSPEDLCHANTAEARSEQRGRPMSEVREVTGTAFVVAEFRARENDEAHPLYVDPSCCIFLDARTRAAADAIRADFPAGEHMPRLRTRYYDDRLGEQIAQGCKQVVILGSGLDTRPVRKALPELPISRSTMPARSTSRRRASGEPASMRASTSSRATTSPPA